MKRNRISEATGSGSSGHFKVPIVLAPQDWTPDQLAPFNEPVYDYTNAELAYEEADGDFKETPEERKKMEDKTELLSKVDTYLKSFYTGQNDDEGSSISDIENPETMIQKAVGPLKEDLAVWFGTKKKPKGSKQPKGPWVNICRKVDGKHPPCGRPEASDKGYPKCRAAGVASKMTDSEKKSACQQKRRAEKTHNKSGTGNSPKMVSYKPKNESMKNTIKLTESELINLVKKVLTEEVDTLRKPPHIQYSCNGKNDKNLPPALNKSVCRRPTERGEKQNAHIDVFCDKVGQPIVSGGVTIANTIHYDCGEKLITRNPPEAYKNVESQERQEKIDSQWLSQFCVIIKNNPRRFKACSSKII